MAHEALRAREKPKNELSPISQTIVGSRHLVIPYPATAESSESGLL